MLVWQDSDRKDPGRVKDKDRLPLVEINDIRQGRSGEVLKRSGNDKDADKYMTFSGKDRTLDVEAPSREGKEWLFAKFDALFQAYLVALQEGRQGDDITARVADIMDGGAPKQAPASTQQQSAKAGASSSRKGHKSSSSNNALPFSASSSSLQSTGTLPFQQQPQQGHGQGQQQYY